MSELSCLDCSYSGWLDLFPARRPRRRRAAERRETEILVALQPPIELDCRISLARELGIKPITESHPFDIKIVLCSTQLRNTAIPREKATISPRFPNRGREGKILVWK